MHYGYGYPCYPISYPTYGSYSSGGVWFALLIVLFVLLLIFGGFWYIGSCYK